MQTPRPDQLEGWIQATGVAAVATLEGLVFIPAGALWPVRALLWLGGPVVAAAALLRARSGRSLARVVPIAGPRDVRRARGSGERLDRR